MAEFTDPPRKNTAFVPPWLHPHRGDPIDMEYVLEAMELEPDVRSSLLAASFETMAEIHAAVARGATKAAEILGGSGVE